jgi:hypothetical protein
VKDVIIRDMNDIRIILKDGSFIDVWFSLKLENRYSFHWDRKHIDGSIYRHDNAPHRKWQSVSTFPKHFHDGDEEEVIESNLDENPENGLRIFLTFVREKFKAVDFP